MLWRRVRCLGVMTAAVFAACGPWSKGDIPDLAHHRARHAMAQGRWDWARVYLEQDLKVHPDRIESVRDFGIAWISGHGGGLAHGVPVLEQYLSVRSDDQIIRRRLVATLIRLGKIEEGLRWAKTLDDSPDSHYLWALLLEENDPEGAQDHLERVVNLDREHAGARALAAQIEERRGNVRAALEWSARGFALDPFDSKNLARHQRLLKETGDHEAAGLQLSALEIVGRLSQSRDAAKLSPVEELALLRELRDRHGVRGPVFDRRMAEVLLRSGHIDEGLALFQSLDRDQRLSIEDRLIFAKILVDVGKRGRARRVYERIVELDPANETALSSLAFLDIGVGRLQEALDRLEQALVDDPWVAVYHAALGKARILTGDDVGAVESLSTAVELAPWEDDWRRTLVDLLKAGGDRKRALTVERGVPEGGGPALPVHTGRTEDDEQEWAAESGAEVPVVPSAEEGPGWWADVSGTVGLDFVQYDGPSGRRYYVETTGSGGGFLDFDDDGDLDVYLLTGAPTPGSPPVDPRPRNALFENRDGHFIDITDKAGVGNDAFGMGLCVGDVDGDGLIDFLVANYGPDRLYRNLGDGSFEEIGQMAGVDDPRWSSNCAFGDIDSDGDLDLYVSHYLEAGFEDNPFCGDRARNISAYCRPSVFLGVSDSLFINSGDGVFTEEGVLRGVLQGELEKGFGVVLTDLDDDGDLDIFVANDSTPNRLYVNDGRGFFDEIGLVSGLGLNDQGMATSGMGVDIGDIDGDLDQDLVLTNFAMESNGIYRNLGNLVFEDVSRAVGMASVSRAQVGWGARLADFDNDGDLDLAIANGHVVDNIKLFEPDNSYEQQNRLLLNDGKGFFEDVSRGAGAPWRRARVSRALTIGDWNNDGRVDILIANANDRFELLENRVENDSHWLGLKLVGRAPNAAAIGTRVVATVGDDSIMREVRSGTGFQSQGDLRLHFGLGDFQDAVTLKIFWPDGSEQVESIGTIDRYVVIRQR